MLIKMWTKRLQVQMSTLLGIVLETVLFISSQRLWMQSVHSMMLWEVKYRYDRFVYLHSKLQDTIVFRLQKKNSTCDGTWKKPSPQTLSVIKMFLQGIHCGRSGSSPLPSYLPKDICIETIVENTVSSG
jgi:hypothetical protein